MYAEILPFAREWDDNAGQAAPAACSSPESFCAHVDALQDDFMVACLDIGHAEMRGLNTSAPEMIHALGHRLQALHIHDNDKWLDSHQIPFSMNIDFVAVAKALKDIGYAGELTLEADKYLKGKTAEELPEAMAIMAASARRLDELMV